MVERERVEQKDQKIGKYEDGSEHVIGALIEVHRVLGPGLSGIGLRGMLLSRATDGRLGFRTPAIGRIKYKGLIVDCGCRIDVLVERRIIVELKAIQRLLALRPRSF